MLVALFHLSWSFPTYVWFYIIGTYFISLPTMWLNSAVQKQGLKVMDGIGSKIKYGIPYTISTMWGQVPFLMLMGAFSKVFANIYPPLHAIGNALTPEQWVGAAVGTAVVGSPRFRNWVSEKLKGLYSSVVEQPFQKKVNSINRLMNLNTCDQIFVFQ